MLCCFLSPNQCLILPRSTFLLRNFFADVLLISSPLVGNSKRKENTISGLYCPKKSPKLFIPKISPWLTFSFIEKNEHTFSLWILGSPCPIILLGKGGGSCFIIIYLCQSTPTPAGLKLVYFIFQYSLCAHIHICVKIQVSHEKASFVLLSCTISLSTAFCSKRELRPASFIFARHPTATATKKVSFYIVDSCLQIPLSKNLGINYPRSPPFRPAPSPKI